MEKKKFALRLSANIICTLLSLLLIWSIIPLSYFIRPGGFNRQNFIGFYAEEKNSLDMVYIGGSACYVYWEPLRAYNKYGFTSYNYAHDTITPEAIRYYLEEVQKTQDPELFVIDLRPFQYGEDYYGGTEPSMYQSSSIRSGADNMKYSSTRFRFLKTATKTKKREEKDSYFFDLLMYKSRIPAMLLSLIDGEKVYGDFDNEEKHPYKGFAFIHQSKSVEFTDYSHVTESEMINEEVNEYFIDTLEYCKRHNLKVLFIVHSFCQSEANKKEFNYMKQMIDAYGFDYLNTNDYWAEINYDYSKDFYNEHHVNVFGAEKYTDFVANYVKLKYNLPDRRNSSETKEWGELYINFEAVSQNAKVIINDMIENRNNEEENNG